MKSHNPDGDIDQYTVKELHLFVVNDPGLGPRLEAIEKPLTRKWQKGTYDPLKAPIAFGDLVESGAKKYHEDLGISGHWYHTFPPNVRRAVARALADEFAAEAGRPAGNTGAATPSDIVVKAEGREFRYDRDDQDKMVRPLKLGRSWGDTFCINDLAGWGLRGMAVAKARHELAARDRRRNPYTGEAIPTPKGHVHRYGVKPRRAPARANPDTVTGDFVDGAARALWASAYISQVEELRDDEPELYDELRPDREWLDVLPPTPTAAMADGQQFAEAVEQANRLPITNIIAIAAAAESVDVDDIDVDDFGWYASMAAMGEGVSWFDDHADFELRLPHWEPSVHVANVAFDKIAIDREALAQR